MMGLFSIFKSKQHDEYYNDEFNWVYFDKYKTGQEMFVSMDDIEISNQNNSFSLSFYQKTVDQKKGYQFISRTHLFIDECKIINEDIKMVQLKDNKIISYKTKDERKLPPSSPMFKCANFVLNLHAEQNKIKL